jgi:hypothetical protein
MSSTDFNVLPARKKSSCSASTRNSGPSGIVDSSKCVNQLLLVTEKISLLIHDRVMNHIVYS